MPDEQLPIEERAEKALDAARTQLIGLRGILPATSYVKPWDRTALGLFTEASSSSMVWKEKTIELLSPLVNAKELGKLKRIQGFRGFYVGQVEDPLTALREELGKYDRVLKSLIEKLEEDPERVLLPDTSSSAVEKVSAMFSSIPTEIRDSLAKFKKKHPDSSKVAFVMMQFGKTAEQKQVSTAIFEAIKAAMQPYVITALRADKSKLHSDVFLNIKTHMHGCGFGVAVFDRQKRQYFNPNVSLEVGYMMALGKEVCLLKDEGLEKLYSDLVGTYYNPFDQQHPLETIPEELGQWLLDNGLVGDLLAPQPGEQLITKVDVADAFKAIPDITDEAVQKEMETIRRTLVFNQVATQTELVALTTSNPVLDTLREIYVKELLRPKDAPLDPVAVASWAPVLYRYKLSPEVKQWVVDRIRLSPEYKEKHQIEIVSKSV